MNKKIFCAFLTILILAASSCSDNSAESQELAGFETFSGPYFGQEPPGDEPQLFMPGFITTSDYERCIVFLDEGRVCVFGRDEIGICYTFIKDDHWTEPRQMPLDFQFLEFDYTAGSDGKTLYFMSIRPTNPLDSNNDCNIWAVKWIGSDWIEPYPLSFLPNTEEYHEAYPTLTSDGTAYFFADDRNDSRAADIYCSRKINGEYQEQERLKWPINSDYDEHDPFVSPDGSYLMYGSRRPGGYGSDDTYICFLKDDGSWTHPVNLGNKLNSISWDSRINVTPDGKFFFFGSGRNIIETPDQEIDTSADVPQDDSGVYWVDTSFINDLKEIMLNRTCAAEVIEREYQENGLSSAINTLHELYSTEQDGYYFSIYELLTLCKRMIEGDRAEDGQLFYEALLNTLPDTNVIKRGFAMVCIMNGLTEKGLVSLKEVMIDKPLVLKKDIYRRGFDLLRFSKIEEAIKVFQFSVREFPDWDLAHYYLATAYERFGDTGLALKHCRKALELNPADSEAIALLKMLEEQ